MPKHSRRWAGFFQTFFRNSDGTIVIAQFPNWPLLLAMFFFVLRYVPSLPLIAMSSWGMSLALLYWSLLEILDGASLFRRGLGLIVGTSVLIGMFGNLLRF